MELQSNGCGEAGRPRQGRLFILSAPSGAGKTTLCRMLLRRFPDLAYSVSATTRDPREGEVPGRDYHFVDRETFEQGIAVGEWAEWARVHDCFYGTSAAFLREGLAAGKDILLDIDVQGTRQILDKFPDAVTIFIMPPTMEVLRTRLSERGTDSPDVIEKRLRNAEAEMAQRGIYSHVIVNDDLTAAADALVAIVTAHRDPGEGGR